MTLEQRQLIPAGFAVIDGEKLIPHDKRYFSDDTHPNDAGHRICGMRLARVLIETGLYRPSEM